MSIEESLNLVREQIRKAAVAAGRAPDSVRLVAVSKTKPADMVLEAMKAGQVLFGENYVQEAGQKIEDVGPGPQWHMIGHLQSNKARLAAELFDVVQTVDRSKLARALDRRAQELGKQLGVLLQVNVGGEAQKAGCTPEEAGALAQEVAKMSGLRLMGLMTMPPFFDQPERVRPFFARLRELSQKLQADLPPESMSELSMGMSGDYQAAIQEGATLVRVGTAIFGSRA
ncbi:MAG: YggS family pyridoxal phosphate-dependent enzyme [Desulfarculaceae bacterium]|jgi:pyridoxal phosphate enzyme (YggS family)